MKFIFKTAGYITFLLFILAIVPDRANAEAVDFSCMKTQVRRIIQVTDQHQEYDVLIRNKCPGPAYWTMCIERMDPWTHEVLMTHNPTGYVEAGNKARVNMQMKSTPNAHGDERRAQEFYVSSAFGIDGPKPSACVAAPCEVLKKSVRAEIARNNKAWRAAREAVEARAVEACPESGWNSPDTDVCRDGIRAAAAKELAVFEETDADLQVQLADVDPYKCAVHGGDVIKSLR